MLKRFFTYLLLLIGYVGAYGQNSTSSPYSRYGYGSIVDGASGQGRGMGGLSVGLRHNQFINFANPACHTAIDSLNFRFELGASAHSSFMTDGDARNHSFSGNLDILALQFPIRNWMGFSMGIMPYSIVGYAYDAKRTQVSDIEGGNLKYTDTYSGEGGINQLLFGFGFRPWKPFSFGANLRVLFGTVSTTSLVSFYDADHSAFYHNMFQTSKNKVSDFSVNFGAQYEITLPEDRSIVIGMTVDPKSELNCEASKEIRTTGVDTVTQNFDNAFDLPLAIGAGISYSIKNKFVAGFDYKFQKWSDARFFDEYGFDDRHKFTLGGEIVPDYMSKRYIRRVSYRFGFSTSNTYYKVNGDTYQENSLTAGFGFPLKRGVNPSILNFTVEYGFAGLGKDDMMKDQSLRFVINATMNERWFVRRRLE